jgi:mRNA interferase MazF
MATVNPKRGEIWDIQFDPAKGQEIRKIRPAVVLNIEKAGRLALRIIVPITTGRESFKRLFWMVEIPDDTTNGLDHDSFADTFQVKSVSVDRFVKSRGVLTASQLDEITAAIILMHRLFTTEAKVSYKIRLIPQMALWRQKTRDVSIRTRIKQITINLLFCPCYNA